MISELDQLLTYSIQNCQDYSSADVALSIFKTDSCLLIPHLKRKKITERDQHGDSHLKSPLQKRCLDPFPKCESQFSDTGQKSALWFSENVFLTQQCLMIKELQSLLEKQKGLLHPGSKHCMTPGEKTSLWMNVGWENKDRRMVLMRHNLCVFPVTIIQFHGHGRNSFGNRSLSICVLNNFQVLMPPGTPSKVVSAIRHFWLANQSLKHTGKSTTREVLSAGALSNICPGTLPSPLASRN